MDIAHDASGHNFQSKPCVYKKKQWGQAPSIQSMHLNFMDSHCGGDPRKVGTCVMSNRRTVAIFRVYGQPPSMTVTVDVAVVVIGIPDGLPLSVTLKVTVETPIKKSRGALLVMYHLRLPSSASVAVAEYRKSSITGLSADTEVAHGAAVTEIGAGGVSVGAVFGKGSSSMVTVAVAVATSPQASVAVKVTVVVPNRKLAGASLLTANPPSSVSFALAAARKAAIAGSPADTDVVPMVTTNVNGVGALTVGAVFGSKTVTVEVAVVVSGVAVGSPLSVTLKVTSVPPSRKLAGASLPAVNGPSSASLAMAPFRKATIAGSLAGAELAHRPAATLIGAGAVNVGAVFGSTPS